MSKPPYEVLEHTADVGIRAYGRTLPELFVNAAWGLIALAVGTDENTESARPVECLPLFVRSTDLEELLVKWLSEILYYMDGEGWTFTDILPPRLEGSSIEAQLFGYRLDTECSRRIAVKAVTYHQLSVRETAEGWEAVVYFDI